MLETSAKISTKFTPKNCASLDLERVVEHSHDVRARRKRPRTYLFAKGGNISNADKRASPQCIKLSQKSRQIPVAMENNRAKVTERCSRDVRARLPVCLCKKEKTDKKKGKRTRIKRALPRRLKLSRCRERGFPSRIDLEKSWNIFAMFARAADERRRISVEKEKKSKERNGGSRPAGYLGISQRVQIVPCNMM